MLDRRERLVEVMQEPSPVLVLRRLPEPLGVVFEPRPLDEQEIRARPFDASLQLQRLEAGHRGDDRARFGEGRLERILETGFDVEQGVLCDHGMNHRIARMTTNYERAFSERPEVYAAWAQLNGAIKNGMELRRYELVTLAAAQRLRSSYCCLAHGTILHERFGEPVLAIIDDRDTAGLDEVDLAVMALAERVVDDATSIGDEDLQRLRDLGLSEAEIMDVILAAAARCFFSKTLDGLGVLPDKSYQELAPELREALVVGRPIADA